MCPRLMAPLTCYLSSSISATQKIDEEEGEDGMDDV